MHEEKLLLGYSKATSAAVEKVLKDSFDEEHGSIL